MGGTAVSAVRVLDQRPMSKPPDKPAAPDPTTPAASAYADDLFCPECGYSLRGLTSERCPECGLDLSFIESEVSIIPWEHRREVGLIKAYWRTVWLINFRGKVFHRASYQPVSQRDSLSFRAVCIAHAFVPIVLAAIMLYPLEPDWVQTTINFTGRQFIPIVCLCVLTCLFVITGLPSYIFDSKLLKPTRRDRAVTLGNYACAWLAWSPLACVFLTLGLLLRDAHSLSANIALIAAGVTAFIVFVAVVADYERIGKRIFGKKRSFWFWEIKSGLAFGIAVFAILVGLPIAAIMVHVLVLSLS